MTKGALTVCRPYHAVRDRSDLTVELTIRLGKNGTL
jgi:hypothetical protein